MFRHRIQKNSELVPQINVTLQSNPTNEFQHQPNVKNPKTKSFDVLGMLLLYTVIHCIINAIPLGVLIGYFGVGPIEAAIEQVFHVKPNSFIRLIDSVFNSAIFLFVLFPETFVLAFLGVNLMLRTNIELAALISYAISQSEFVCVRYILLRRQYLRIADDVSILMGHAVLFSQGILCIFAWSVLTGSKLFPTALLVILFLATIIMLSIILIALKSQSHCRVSSEQLVKKHVNGFHVYGCSGGANGYLRRMWNCQLPLRIYCGKQFVIGKDAIMNYLYVLSSNLTNLLVLVKI